MSSRTPLYGHNSPDTAYLVQDYPYGFRLRCQIRYWVEHHPTRGYRFMSQTTNPKASGTVWNKPKASTYALIAACMYLDENGHVQWDNVTEYASPEHAAAFVAAFPGADLGKLREWAKRKAVVSGGLASGALVMRLNGAPVPVDTAKHASDATAWAGVGATHSAA